MQLRMLSTLRSGRRLLSTRMPVGATPQILINASGAHPASMRAVTQLTSLIVEHGASIAATKKIVMHDQFSLMMSVWVPPSSSPATVLAALDQTAAAEHFGCLVKAVALPDPSPAAPPEVRRMVLECPQKPGIVLAVTELLKDQGCAITNMDAQTYLKDETIWFRLECIIEASAWRVHAHAHARTCTDTHMHMHKRAQARARARAHAHAHTCTCTWCRCEAHLSSTT